MSNNIINACIIGASGYTGAELIRLLYNHDEVNISYLVADRNAGKYMGELYSHLQNYDLPKIISLNKVNWNNCNVVFCCLPHGTSQEIIKSLPDHLKIIDLSADFRLSDIATYDKWYGKHIAHDLQKIAVYGQSELFRQEIKNARLVACPGCYPTSAILPLTPLLKNNLISTDNIIIDSKSGVTGAGRSAKQDLLYCEINNSLKAYNICKHRHQPEIEQTLSLAANKNIEISFTPHLIPMNRGILSTIYVDINDGYDANDLTNTLKKHYENEEFVTILEDGLQPTTSAISGTNKSLISVNQGRNKNKAIIISAIDNLVKGASGQAVQNMNIMFGKNEKMGIDFIPVFP